MARAGTRGPMPSRSRCSPEGRTGRSRSQPASLARPLLQVDFTRTALYHELHAQCGLWPDAGWERLRPVLPTAEQRDLLGLGARTPALAIERRASSHGTPVEWRHGLVRADRFSYVARWAAQDLGAGFEPAS